MTHDWLVIYINLYIIVTNWAEKLVVSNSHQILLICIINQLVSNENVLIYIIRVILSNSFIYC